MLYLFESIYSYQYWVKIRVGLDPKCGSRYSDDEKLEMSSIWIGITSTDGVGLDDKESFPKSLLNHDLYVQNSLGLTLPSVEPWSIKLLCELDALSSSVLLPGKLLWLPVLRASCSMLVSESS